MEYSSHSLAYEIMQSIKTTHPIFQDLSPSEMSVRCLPLNKFTSYLSLFLSLNSFCDVLSRTWASLSPETKCVISIKRLCIKPQSRLHSFTWFHLRSPFLRWMGLSVKESDFAEMMMCSFWAGSHKTWGFWDFPDGPLANTLHSQCKGPKFNPWSGN